MSANRDYLQGLKILYVEDDSAIRESLSRFLRRRTTELIVAENGEEGFEFFNSSSPDMIITDIRMPVLDGLDMIEKVRQVDTDIPIIITTGHNDEEFYQRAIDLGVDKYIKKPVNLKDLVNIMTRSARGVIQQRELEAQSRLIREILDISQNFMIITDGVDISYVNKSLLNFASCVDLEAFRARFAGFAGLLVPFENAFYKNKSFSEWMNFAAKDSGDNKLIIYMQAPNEPVSDILAFLVQVNRFPRTSEMLVSFSDVTHIEREKLHYQELAQYDELTKIFNRKKFNDELTKEIDRVIRYRQNLSLATFDVDHFKLVNDTFGHLTGDYVLKEIVHVVNASIRRSDIFCRYGGEEFTLLMPETPLKSARDTAERIRSALEENVFGEVGQVTCSFGVTDYKLEDTPESFVKRSDEALYLAKNNGRNRVEVLT